MHRSAEAVLNQLRGKRTRPLFTAYQPLVEVATFASSKKFVMFAHSLRSRARSTPSPSAQMMQLPPPMRMFVTPESFGAIFPYPRRHPQPSAYRPMKKFTELESP